MGFKFLKHYSIFVHINTKTTRKNCFQVLVLNYDNNLFRKSSQKPNEIPTPKPYSFDDKLHRNVINSRGKDTFRVTKYRKTRSDPGTGSL